MHYQIPPFEEAKIITCTKGSIYDVAVDLRKDSSTYSQYVAIELSEKNFKMMYVPRGCAHGFQTIEDDTFVYYQMTGLFHPDCARGIRWDDPAIGIIWPVPPVIISEKDQGYLDLTL